MGSACPQTQEKKEAFTSLQINDSTIEMKADSGPKSNALSAKTFEKLKRDEQIKPCSKPTNLVAHGGSKIQTLRIC